jgi:hypothetical protein
VGTVDGPSDRSGAGGNIPYARTLVALAPNHFEEIRAAVGAAFRTAHTEAFAALVDAGAGAVERHRPRHFAVFMGYDFHIGPDGPRLIEINTNAGGALLNGLHTAALCRPERLACACRELLPVDAMEKRLFGTFTAEFAAARPGVALRRVAIADDRPAEQPLRSEFELFRLLFERAGVEASVCDVAQLERVPGGLALAGRALDLVYLRDTDWRLEAPRSRALREAYLADDVLVTPSPREHHLLANKERLALFARADAMQALGASPADAALLASLVPETRRLDELGLEGVLQARHRVREPRRLPWRQDLAAQARGDLRPGRLRRAAPRGSGPHRGRDRRGPAAHEVRRARLRLPRRGAAARRARLRGPGHEPAHPRRRLLRDLRGALRRPGLRARTAHLTVEGRRRSPGGLRRYSSCRTRAAAAPGASSTSVPSRARTTPWLRTPATPRR